jgi:hypothetical protein
MTEVSGAKGGSMIMIPFRPAGAMTRPLAVAPIP